jgi:hypothetical protein
MAVLTSALSHEENAKPMAAHQISSAMNEEIRCEL